ncbi:MAG: tripartite tricarboxylate transporter TctB family protein [Pseudomonadota bacterium]
MTLSKDRIGALLLLVFCCGYWYMTYQIRMLPFQAAAAFNSRTMPEALAVLGTGLCLLLLVFPGSDEKLELKGFKWGLGAMMIGLMVFYGLALRPLGFLLSTSIFLMGGFLALGERNPLTLILAAVPITVAFWALMNYGLDIYVQPLPEIDFGTAAPPAAENGGTSGGASDD